MNWKKIVLAAVALAVTAAWLALPIGYAAGVDKTVWIVLVTIPAVATEAGFWIAAAVLGVSVFQARRKIWLWASRPFRRTA